jgi:hypothetical protein
VLARALKFAEWWAVWMGVKVPEWRAETYFSFVTKFLLGMGLGFELPVVLLALVKIGVLDYQKLTALRRYMIVINLVLGALLTTPEPFHAGGHGRGAAGSVRTQRLDRLVLGVARTKRRFTSRRFGVSSNHQLKIVCAN